MHFKDYKRIFDAVFRILTSMVDRKIKYGVSGTKTHFHHFIIPSRYFSKNCFTANHTHKQTASQRFQADTRRGNLDSLCSIPWRMNCLTSLTMKFYLAWFTWQIYCIRWINRTVRTMRRCKMSFSPFLVQLSCRIDICLYYTRFFLRFKSWE